uniref:F-BAR domain-containing protein n=1 Tax=Syphacia muris TaxID=451379 RepID=A0A0N5AJP7_9BILA
MNNRRSGPVSADRYCLPLTTTSPNRNGLHERRAISAGKLSQFFGGGGSERTSTSSLHSGLQDLGMTSKLATKMAESQVRGADLLEQWARHSQNAAIDDVMHQTSQLFRIFSEKQLQFAKDYEHFLKQLHKIVDAERMVKEAEKKVLALEEKERKLKREIQKGTSFLRKGGKLAILRQELEGVLITKRTAERVLSETRAEMEVVKMFRFRHGMQGIADSYRMLGQNCQAIFDCHREITEMVPAVGNEDVRRMVYEGIPITRERVEHLRRLLTFVVLKSLEPEPSGQYVPPVRRRSEPARNRTRACQGTPPPPYTPTAPPDEHLQIPVFNSSTKHHQ